MAAQTTSSFKDPDQMAIQHATVVQLGTEGINGVKELGEFDKDNLNQVTTNLRRPPIVTFKLKGEGIDLCKKNHFS